MQKIPAKVYASVSVDRNRARRRCPLLGLGKRDKSEEVRPSLDEVEEEHSFDDLARGLASSSVSRGKALKLAGAALLGSAAVPFLAGTAEAKKKKKKKKGKCRPRTHLCINPHDGSHHCCPKGTECCTAGSGVACCKPGLNLCDLLSTGISACVTLPGG